MTDHKKNSSWKVMHLENDVPALVEITLAKKSNDGEQVEGLTCLGFPQFRCRSAVAVSPIAIPFCCSIVPLPFFRCVAIPLP